MDLIDRQALLKQIDIDSDGEPGYYGDTWKFIDTIKSMPSATDTNVGTKLGTDLAQLGTDLISRQAAIDVLNSFDVLDGHTDKEEIKERIKQLPPAQSDIIYCKDCVKHNKGLGNYEVHPDGSSTWIWKGSACPLVSWRGKAQGHEFDYQFCAYAERREVTE